MDNGRRQSPSGRSGLLAERRIAEDEGGDEPGPTLEAAHVAAGALSMISWAPGDRRHLDPSSDWRAQSIHFHRRRRLPIEHKLLTENRNMSQFRREVDEEDQEGEEEAPADAFFVPTD